MAQEACLDGDILTSFEGFCTTGEWLQSGSSGAAPEPSGARWSKESGSYDEPLQSSSGQLHTTYLLCSHPFGSTFAEQLRSGSTNHQFYMLNGAAPEPKAEQLT